MHSNMHLGWKITQWWFLLQIFLLLRLLKATQKTVMYRPTFTYFISSLSFLIALLADIEVFFVMHMRSKLLMDRSNICDIQKETKSKVFCVQSLMPWGLNWNLSIVIFNNTWTHYYLIFNACVPLFTYQE